MFFSRARTCAYIRENTDTSINRWNQVTSNEAEAALGQTLCGLGFSDHPNRYDEVISVDGAQLRLHAKDRTVIAENHINVIVISANYIFCIELADKRQNRSYGFVLL